MGRPARLGARRAGRRRRFPRRGRGRADPRGRGDRGAAAAGPLLGLLQPDRGRAGPMGRRERRRLGRPPGAASRQGHRGAARGAPGSRAGPRAVRVPRRRRRADGPARGDDRAAHPDRGAGFARPAAAGTALAAPRGRGRVTRPRGRTDGSRAGDARSRPRICDGQPGAARAQRAFHGPAPPRHGCPGAPADHGIGAGGGRLRGRGPGCAPAGRLALPAGPGSAGRRDERLARGPPARARSGSAAWSSPASTR